MKANSAVAMSNASSVGRLIRAAWVFCHDRLERHQALAQIRQMDDHMLRQFGLSRIVVETL